MSDVDLADRQDKNASDGVFTGGAVRFVADGKPRSFGIGLDDEEADRVVTLLRDFLARHQSVVEVTVDAAAPGTGDDGAPKPTAG